LLGILYIFLTVIHEMLCLMAHFLMLRKLRNWQH